MNLWILTEERPKINVIKSIIDINYSATYGNIKIKPRLNKDYFEFIYDVNGINIEKIDNIFIKIVSGETSFVDFLVFEQINEPDEDNWEENNLKYVVEETKTNDRESRNTAVYQRAIKFIVVNYYYPNIQKYMLYNINEKSDKRPSSTNIFGTRLLKLIGVNFVGVEEKTSSLDVFKNIDEIIEFKNEMKPRNKNDTVIRITKSGDSINISGKLSKKDNGTISNDPNIGALSLIAVALRKMGWENKIIITNHKINQNKIPKGKKGNKFLYICNLFDISLEGIEIGKYDMPKNYWKYDKKSEKVASILLHLQAEFSTIYKSVYENHAGCERGYLYDSKNNPITIKKKISGEKVAIPDLVLQHTNDQSVLIIEGKQLNKVNDGLSDIKKYDLFENEYITIHCNSKKITRWVALFGGNNEEFVDEKVIFHLKSDGKLHISKKAPMDLKKIFD